ncbi:MAG: trehalose-6-phosphate synthase [Anaerolineae bacterium]|nr:MAG: trehalose-6-phosphate synthase [Anaerolineae bacterium]
MADKDPLIIIASNRGPYSFSQKEDGTFESKRGAGGLVTALAGLAEKHDVLWVAASLSEDDRKWAEAGNNQPQTVEGISLRLLIPEAGAYRGYYEVIANPLLWFIQHQLWDAPRQPSITRETWNAWNNGYVVINQLFADAIVEMVKDVDRPVIVLPQDYHLYLLPRFLRDQLGSSVQIQPFIHIPWPGTDAWSILPGQIRDTILDGLLASDRVGFQTNKDAFNFVQTCRYYLADAHSHGSRTSITYRGQRILANAYPISIDVEKVQELANSNEALLLRTTILNFVGDRKLILRTDRIEPSKNILRGLEAFRVLLENHPEYYGKIHMMALLVPSRMEVIEYQNYLQEIMAVAGLINANYSEAFWEPVRIIVGDNYTRAIAAMQLYHVLLVNPLADGMNLVAKEGVLVNQRDGVLILSEHAGAFFELGEHALTVSPFDVYGTAEAMHQALNMPVEERRKRAAALREKVTQADIKQWFYQQIQDALSASKNQAKNAVTSEVPAAKASA